MYPNVSGPLGGVVGIPKPRQETRGLVITLLDVCTRLSYVDSKPSLKPEP